MLYRIPTKFQMQNTSSLWNNFQREMLHLKNGESFPETVTK
uniref:Uncharacterized protein n=1 Tax=Anguilla anguilla TaxID=7936 RepID=A0A0E9PX23_ANGAN